MKVLVVFAFAIACAAAYVATPNTAFGHIQNVAIPLGDKIRKIEEASASQRIIGGTISQEGQFPYQAGLLSRYHGIDGTGVCGGSLVTADRVISAAHCWFDGINQAYITTVVLGSNTLFTGGVRQDTSAVIPHPEWHAPLVHNDVSIIYLPIPISFSSTIAPIALPSGSEIDEDFAGETAVASGFGLTQDGGSIPANQVLSHVRLDVIPNDECLPVFPLNLLDSNICTSGTSGSVCSGDSGGPLVISRNDKQILIGITSFGSPLGCEFRLPAAYARITSYLDFFNEHL